MAASQPKPRYADAEYLAAHNDIYSHPLVEGIQTVLPPNVNQDEFNRALEEFTVAVGGANAVFSGQNLKEYVDPYEIPESGHGSNIPSAAVW